MQELIHKKTITNKLKQFYLNKSIIYQNFATIYKKYKKSLDVRKKTFIDTKNKEKNEKFSRVSFFARDPQ